MNKTNTEHHLNELRVSLLDLQAEKAGVEHRDEAPESVRDIAVKLGTKKIELAEKELAHEELEMLQSSPNIDQQTVRAIFQAYHSGGMSPVEVTMRARELTQTPEKCRKSKPVTKGLSSVRTPSWFEVAEDPHAHINDPGALALLHRDGLTPDQSGDILKLFASMTEEENHRPHADEEKILREKFHFSFDTRTHEDRSSLLKKAAHITQLIHSKILDDGLGSAKEYWRTIVFNPSTAQAAKVELFARFAAAEVIFRAEKAEALERIKLLSDPSERAQALGSVEERYPGKPASPFRMPGEEIRFSAEEYWNLLGSDLIKENNINNAGLIARIRGVKKAVKHNARFKTMDTIVNHVLWSGTRSEHSLLRLAVSRTLRHMQNTPH